MKERTDRSKKKNHNALKWDIKTIYNFLSMVIMVRTITYHGMQETFFKSVNMVNLWALINICLANKIVKRCLLGIWVVQFQSHLHI